MDGFSLIVSVLNIERDVNENWSGKLDGRDEDIYPVGMKSSLDQRPASKVSLFCGVSQGMGGPNLWLQRASFRGSSE
jgi:hypothetical protein